MQQEISFFVHNTFHKYLKILWKDQYYNQTSAEYFGPENVGEFRKQML